jgi:hypothetical protein
MGAGGSPTTIVVAESARVLESAGWPSATRAGRQSGAPFWPTTSTGTFDTLRPASRRRRCATHWTDGIREGPSERAGLAHSDSVAALVIARTRTRERELSSCSSCCCCCCCCRCCVAVVVVVAVGQSLTKTLTWRRHNTWRWLIRPPARLMKLFPVVCMFPVVAARPPALSSGLNMQRASRSRAFVLANGA